MDGKRPTRVFVRMAYKINMGNYETLDLDYAVEADANDGETARAAHQRVKDFVADMLHEDVADQKAGLKGKRPGVDRK